MGDLVLRVTDAESIYSVRQMTIDLPLCVLVETWECLVRGARMGLIKQNENAKMSRFKGPCVCVCVCVCVCESHLIQSRQAFFCKGPEYKHTRCREPHRLRGSLMYVILYLLL